MTPFPALRRPASWPTAVGTRVIRIDLPTTTGVVALVVGLVVLFAWAFDVPALTKILPQAVAMKPNTAASFVLLGSSVAFIAGRDTGRRQLAGRVLCVVVVLVGAATLLEYVGHLDLGIDQVIFRAPSTDLGGAPGRMAPLTAVCFCLLGVAALAVSLGVGRRMVGVLAGGAALIATLNIVEFAFDAEAPTFLAGYTAMAVHTAFTMGVLSIGILGALRSDSPFAAIAGQTASARMFRRLLAISVAVPAFMAWARLQGQSLGWYGTNYGTSLMLVGSVAVIVVGILRATRWASDLETKRAAADTERDQFFDMSLDMLVVMGRDGRFSRVNAAWATTFGFAVDEIVGKPWTDFIHPDDLERTIEEAQHNLVEGEPAIGFTNRYRNSDGSYRWLEWVSQQAPSGAVAFAVARDVTDRKRVDDRRIRQTRILEARNDALSDRVAHDSLTGLHNRRFFETAVTRLERSWARQPLEQRPPISVVLFDLDHFGEVNNDYGHQAGDAVLRQFAAILKKRFRESDVVARYGGEEFVAVLEGATAADARRIAEGIRTALEGVGIAVGSGPPIRVTVSAGCAQLGDEANVSAGIAVADVWLAQAKRSGRNQVVGL